jgi:hypothetical protein
MADIGRKRDAHKGIVKKRVAEIKTLVVEARDRGADPDFTRLKQLNQNLQEKIEIISKLDEQILDGMDDEEEMMRHIEEADEFRQVIHDAIDQVDAIIDSRVDTMCTKVSPAPHNTHIRPKLPELTLNTFEGDITTWNSFWDAHESAVHNNSALSNIDKFTYLKSLVARSARDAIEGLPLTASNYEEAIGILQKQFGNKQLIISRHMDILLSIESVSSVSDITALRRMYDKVEAHVRGLRALGVNSESYEALLAPVLQKKLPSEFRLIINRELSETWDLDRLMSTLAEELEVRERSGSNNKI